ncbi:MAG: hypothetical protein A3I66_04170 [Burkholderiales bacterium RIFCSPLOWO2_02_FULL_57_36]|nr:MAG: hypothetical protein A3I66_04170 [Burkholderiales bacterium RIFCSPLOWO2_02_FULL_57_36]
MNNLFAGLATWVVRNRIVVVVAVALMTGFLAMNAKNLKLIIDPNSLMPQSHPYVSTTNLVEQVFGSKYVVVIGLKPKSGDIYQEAVLAKVAELTQKLNETPGVSRSNLLSLYAKRAKDIKGSADGMAVTPIGRPGSLSPEDMARVKESLVRNPVYQSILVSPDQRMTAIVVEMKERPGGFRAMMEPINRLVADASSDQLEVFVGGNPVFLAASEKFSARMAILFPLAILIVGLIHFEAFRTFQGLFLPLLTAITSVVWGLGAMGLFRIPLDVFNTPTPILILAVAAGHAVQLLKRYYEEYNRLVGVSGMSKVEAKRQAVVDSIAGVGPVMFIAALVAALGFLSLLVFEISSIRTFGLFTAVGILSALFLEMTLIPAIRAMLPAPSDKERALESKKRIWDRIPAAIGVFVMGGKRHYVLAGLVIVIAISAIGITRIQVDNSSKGFFSASQSFQRDDEQLNAALAGTNTLYVVIEGKSDDAIKDPMVLRGIDQLQSMLQQQELVGKTVSITDFIKRMNQAMNGDDPKYFRIPESQELVSQFLFLYSLSGEPSDFDSYVDYQYRRANLVVYLKSGSTAYVKDLISKIDAMVPAAFGDRVTVRIGGSVPQTAALTDVMVEGKIKNIVQIGSVIFVISALLFRSILAGFLVMAPLALAALVNFAVMGWTGIPLNIPNSLSTAMAVGIGADYAIYLIYRLREELKKTSDMQAAVKAAMTTAGKASLFVASAVAGGYSVLLLSIGFKIHNWLGILICIAMFTSVFAALILIPYFVTMFRPRFIFPGRQALPAKTSAATALCVLALVGATHSGDTLAADAPVEKIMEKNLAVSKVVDSALDTTILLTNQAGQTRTRKTNGYTKLRPDGQDNMRFTRFVEPADVRGTGVLLIEQSGADDHMWIWLPALKKVRRLVSSNKRDGFLGTDLSYGDVIGHRVADWTHRVLKEEDVDGQRCFVVESAPVSKKVQTESGYSKRLTWIRADNFVTVKGEFWDEAGQMLKRMRATDVKRVDDAREKWQAMNIEVNNLQTGHTTNVKVDALKVNQKIPDDIFTTRYLEKE